MWRRQHSVYTFWISETYYVILEGKYSGNVDVKFKINKIFFYFLSKKINYFFWKLSWKYFFFFKNFYVTPHRMVLSKLLCAHMAFYCCCLQKFYCFLDNSPHDKKQTMCDDQFLSASDGSVFSFCCRTT